MGRIVVGALIAVILCSGRAAAQTPSRLELAATYSALRNTEQTATAFPLGCTGEVAVAATGWLAIVGEGSVNARTAELGPGVRGSHVYYYTVLGGPRVTTRVAAHVRAFGQALLGATHAGWSGAFVIAGAPGPDANFKVIQPGGGVDVSVSDRWSLRLGADLRFVQPSITPARQLRLTTGISFRR